MRSWRWDLEFLIAFVSLYLCASMSFYAFVPQCLFVPLLNRPNTNSNSFTFNNLQHKT